MEHIPMTNDTEIKGQHGIEGRATAVAHEPVKERTEGQPAERRIEKILTPVLDESLDGLATVEDRQLDGRNDTPHTHCCWWQ